MQTMTWKKQPEHAGAMINGVVLAPASAPAFGELPAGDFAEPELPALRPGQRRASGVVMVEPDGRVWIVEPTNHFGGYRHTFPKGRAEPGLTLQQNAVKEGFEESGLVAEILGYLGDFEGTSTNTRYYLARRRAGAPWAAGWESQAVRLAPADIAARLLNAARDRRVLAAVFAD
jgi:ADP-ribose pyrophosphatase YjhB (NUDIX family)